MSLQATLYLRIPVELRERIDRATLQRAHGNAKRGDMRQLVIDALTVGLDQLTPLCGARDGGGPPCILARGHQSSLAGDALHSNGTRTWSDPAVKRPLERSEAPGSVSGRSASHIVSRKKKRRRS